MPAKNLTFTIDIQNTDDGVKKLLQKVKPTWEWDNVGKKELSGGYSCVMLRFYDKNNHNDSVTVRIRNLLSDLSDEQQKFEMKLLPILSERGQFPDLLATFKNGYCYQYIKGQPVVNLKTGEIIIKDSILKAVAKKLVKVHTMEIPGVDYSSSKYFEFFLNMIKNSDFVPSNPQLPTRECLKKECEYMKSFLDNLNTPLGLCHGDFHLGNMVWNQEKESITFVDWELVHTGYLYTDISHFISLTSSLWAENVVAFATNVNLDNIPKDYTDTFCKFYYEEWINHHNKEYVQEEFESFKANVRIFELCDSLMFLLSGLVFPEEKAKTLISDLPKFQERNLILYLATKKKYCGSDKFGSFNNSQQNGFHTH